MSRTTGGQDGPKHTNKHPSSDTASGHNANQGRQSTEVTPLPSTVGSLADSTYTSVHEQVTPLPSRVIGFREMYLGGGPTIEEDFFREIYDVLAQDFDGPLDDSHGPGRCLAESDLFNGMDLREIEPEMSQNETNQARVFSDDISKAQPAGSRDSNQNVATGQTSLASSHRIEGPSGLNTGLAADKGTDQSGEKAAQVARAMSNDFSGIANPLDGERRPDLELSGLINEIMCAATPELDKAKTPAFTGVIKHSRKKRWEAHIWIPSLRKQVYLGCFENEMKAATAYDIAVLCDRGRDAATNLPIDRYAKFLDFVTAEEPAVREVLTLVKRFSNGFTRGICKFRGVTKHPNGHWEARIGVTGNRNIYLGLHESEADAGRSYDRARVRMKGASATTNFPISDYVEEAKEHDRWRKGVKCSTKTMADKLYSQWVRFGGEDLLETLIEKRKEQEGRR